MLFDTQRSPNRVEVRDFSALLSRDYKKNMNTRKYLLSQSPLPMSFRDLRFVMTNHVPSNIVILPKSSSTSSGTLSNSTMRQERKIKHRRRHKQTGADVYRSLIGTESRCSILSGRDTPNDDMIVLANSFTIDRKSPSPTYGFFRPQNLPKIRKYPTTPNTNNNQVSSGKPKNSCAPSSSSRMQHVEHMQPTPPEMFHRTTPTGEHYEENNSKMITTTIISSNVGENRTRKQLHIYIP